LRPSAPGVGECLSPVGAKAATPGGALMLPVAGRGASIDPAAFLAPTSVVLGDVTIAAGASIWYNTVLRGDVESIAIGVGSNVQDNCTVHADPGFPVTVGRGVSVGHNAVLHGCVVEDGALVGMGATVLNGARIGAGCLVAAQALVPQGLSAPPNSLIAGVPARLQRELTPEERALLTATAEGYITLARLHQEAAYGGG
jgi:carbonic anhydrase/acetyltransferase-like protein (isoleucine patch superfamily)